MAGIYNQYNISKQSPLSTAPEQIDTKTASRQIGGMKAQGVTSVTVDIGNKDIQLPRMEYVEILEKQIKESRERIAQLEKQLITTNNRLQRVINTVKQDVILKR